VKLEGLRRTTANGETRHRDPDASMQAPALQTVPRVVQSLQLEDWFGTGVAGGAIVVGGETVGPSGLVLPREVSASFDTKK
jgi:hypothetical protein